MKNHIILLLLFTATAFAQNAALPGELTVDGKAKVKIAPDIITFTLDVKKEGKAESDALKELNAELDELQKFFAKSGIPVKQVKISGFTVSSAVLKKSAQKVYIASASLFAEMQLDYKLVNDVYMELQSGKYKDVTVSYNTSLSDELDKKTRETLLQEAIADAKQKAERIAKPFGVKISCVKNINKGGGYSRNENGVPDELEGYIEAGMEQIETIFTKFEVEDYYVEEYINVVFYVKN